MHVRAQVAMVMNLDKCIGCHTCSVTCKQVWTNRPGTEYVWFNNVETRPGQGYPRTYEDQDRWEGGWTLNRRGRLSLRAGLADRLASVFRRSRAAAARRLDRRAVPPRPAPVGQAFEAPWASRLQRASAPVGSRSRAPWRAEQAE